MVTGHHTFFCPILFGPLIYDSFNEKEGEERAGGGRRIIVQLELSLIGKSHSGQRSNILDEEGKEEKMRAQEKWQ